MPAELDPVHELALLLVAELLARELARVGPEGPHLRLEPRLGYVAEQHLGVLGERGRLARLLRLDALGELVGTVEGVDELVGVLPEPEAELDVPLRYVLHRRIVRRTIALR